MERFKGSLKLNVYIKIDTGLNRIGVKPEEALNLAKKVLSYKNLILEGISTHYASADMNDEESINFTKKQIITFNEVVNNLKENNIKVNIIHSANSAAILSYKESYFNMVRAGIILYGYPQIEKNLKIKPVMEVKSKIVLIKSLKKGESVSYGMTFKADKDTKIALIPIGYADGIPIKLSNNWNVKINTIPSPWGFDNEILFKIYMNASADDYECPTVVTDDSHRSWGKALVFSMACWWAIIKWR